MVDWKVRYDQLAKLQQSLVDCLEKTHIIIDLIGFHVRESDSLDLREREVVRYMRLKGDCSLSIEYENSRTADEPKLYKAGTLIECSRNGHVYLDLDGDGHLYFPMNLLEPVEINYNDTTKYEIVYQG